MCGALLVADVVERRGVLVERDDVLIRRLGVVLPGRAQKREMQFQLGPIRRSEEPPQLFVPGRGAPIRLGEAMDLIRRLAHPQLIERADQRERIAALARDAQLVRGAQIVADESGAPRHQLARAGRFHHIERAPEVIALGRRGRLPVARLQRADQSRPRARLDDEQAARLGERQPVLEVRRGAQGPEGIVGFGALHRRPGMDDQRRMAALVHRGCDPALKFLDVAAVERCQVHATRSIATSAAFSGTSP